MDLSNYTIHRFTIKDVAAYKALRLEALQLEPGMFGSSYALELSFTDEQWIARVNNPGGACFGLYCDGEPVGITGIVARDTDAPGDAYMTQSYIRKLHRGQGLSRLFYRARLQWAAEHHIKRLIISHRESNLASKAANQRFGFVYTHREPRTWPDGSTEDNVFYELLL